MFWWKCLRRWWHCWWTGHEPVDGTCSIWCGTCGMEWKRPTPLTAEEDEIRMKKMNCSPPAS